MQFCSSCGELSHRQDICLAVACKLQNACKLCGDENPQPSHSGQPKCKLCDLPHETAGNDCKKRLRPSPPPLHVRERSVRHPDYSGDTSAHCPPAQETRSTDNTKVSWSQVLKHSPTAPNPFPPLPDRSSNTNTQHYKQTISALRSQNAELTKRLELIDKTAQSRIEALERQIEELVTRTETSQSS